MRMICVVNPPPQDRERSAASAAVTERLIAAGCVFASDEATLLVQAAEGSDAELSRLVARRVAGEPLEQILGWAEFCGRRIVVAPSVFVPRRRTEFLVEVAAARLVPGATVVEVCCGTGAISVALADRVPGLCIHAVDVDEAAVGCARANLVNSQAREVFVACGDLFEPLPAAIRGRVELIVANAPYVPTDEIGFLPAEARLHEPLIALDGGADGLDVHRRVVTAASPWLGRGGSVVMESSLGQADALAALTSDAELVASVTADDDREVAVVIGSATRSPFRDDV